MELIYDEMKQIPVFSSLKEAVSFVCGTDTIIENFSEYDTVYIGFPIWYGSAPKVQRV